MSAQTAYAYYYTANVSLPQYAPDLVQLYLQDNTLWNLVGKSNKLNADGKFYLEQPVLAALGFTAAPYAEGGSRGTYYGATPIKATWDMWRLHAPYQITGDAFDMGKVIGPDGSLDIKATELANTMVSFDYLMALSLRGEHTGRISTVTAAANSTTQSVDDATVFRPGVRVKFGTDTTTYTVTTVNDSAKTIVVSGGTPNTTLADGVFYDSTGTGSAQASYQPYGIADLINHNADLTGPNGYIIRKALTTYAGISRSSYEKWQSTIYAPSAGYTVNENHIKTSLSKIARRQNRAQSKVKWALCSVDTAEMLMSLMPLKERDQKETRVIVGSDGVEVVSMAVEGNRIAVKPVTDYSRYVIDWVNPADIEIRQVDNPNWVKNPGTGEVLKHNFNEVSGTDTFTGTFYWKGNLVGRPLEHGALAGFAVPDGIDR